MNEKDEELGVRLRNKYRLVIEGNVARLDLIELTCAYYEDGKCTRKNVAQCQSVTCDARFTRRVKYDERRDSKISI